MRRRHAAATLRRRYANRLEALAKRAKAKRLGLWGACPRGRDDWAAADDSERAAAIDDRDKPARGSVLRERAAHTQAVGQQLAAAVREGYFDGEEQAQPFDTQAEAIDAAQMMESGGASGVTVARGIVRVVQDVGPVEWQDPPE